MVEVGNLHIGIDWICILRIELIYVAWSMRDARDMVRRVYLGPE